MGQCNVRHLDLSGVFWKAQGPGGAPQVRRGLVLHKHQILVLYVYFDSYLSVGPPNLPDFLLICCKSTVNIQL